MDLQESRGFEELGVELLSISPDHVDSWRQVEAEFGLETPLLSDPRNGTAARYGVMEWRVPPDAPIESAEPGHTFVLVDKEGRVAWVRDYGAQENGGLMYVPPRDILSEIEPLIGVFRSSHGSSEAPGDQTVQMHEGRGPSAAESP